MARNVKRTSAKAGLPPGTLVHVGRERTESVRMTLIDYDEGQFQERALTDVTECFPCRDTNTVSWINVDGVHDIAPVEAIGKHFGLHPLVLEDIVSTNQRPKADDYESYLYLVLKMLQYDDAKQEVTAEQVSIILGKGYVLSFQERPGDVFDAVRDRIRAAKGRIRKMRADYLAYALLDATVDSYFAILEKTGNRVEGMEEDVVTEPTARTLQNVQHLRTELILLRNSVWPLREMINALRRAENPLIGEAVEPYLADVYDHTIRVAESTDTLRDMVGGLRDTYMSSVSNRMNEIMKVLTIIATIFIPITFIAGIYGMNFEYMPELKLKGAYFVALGAMTAVAVAMLAYFRRKKWL